MATRTYKFKNLPLKKSKEIIYVENSYDNIINDYIKLDYDVCEIAADYYHRIFRYIPKLGDLIATNDKVISDFKFSQEERDAFKKLDSSWLLNFLEDPSDRESFKPSLVYWGDDLDPLNSESDITTLYATEINPDKDLEMGFDSIYNSLPKLTTEYDGMTNVFYSEIDPQEVSERTYSKDIPPEILDSYSEDIARLKKIFNEQLELGVPYELIYYVLDKNRPERPLVIGKDYSITVKYVDNGSIFLDALPKAFYFLFLRHREGIKFNELIDKGIKEELISLYQTILGRPLRAQENKFVDTLVKGEGSANQKRSIIRKAFAEKLGEKSCEPYVISGDRDTRYKVTLKDELITWDCEDIVNIPLGERDIIKKPNKEILAPRNPLIR